MNDVLDPFDPASLRLDQIFTDGTAVKKLITTIPVRKPSRQDFVRVHPAYRLSPAAITLQLPAGSGLLGALSYYGFDGMDSSEKEAVRDLVLRGRDWSEQEREAILSYCEQDVAALARLLPPMLRHIDLPRALLRGRYMAAAATMEHNGVPLDAPLLAKLRECWDDIQDQLIAEIDADYGVFDGRSFKADRFASWLAKMDIPWPRLDSGKLDLSDNAFRQAARAHPCVAALRELRSSLSDLRLADLAVGPDDRNRCLLSAFRSRTSRNQPSNSRFIFGPSVWLRGLIKPPPGYGLAYIDWSQQEFGIAAALSDDPAMIDAYRSGDPYLAFALQAGAVPTDATKHTHQAKREQFKACVLAVQYGMGPDALAARIGQPAIMGRELIRLHRETYKVFWRWSDAALDHATLRGSIHTVFGWRVHTLSRALKALANAGLVNIEGRGKRSPKVTIVVSAEQDEPS